MKQRRSTFVTYTASLKVIESLYLSDKNELSRLTNLFDPEVVRLAESALSKFFAEVDREPICKDAMHFINLLNRFVTRERNDFTNKSVGRILAKDMDMETIEEANLYDPLYTSFILSNEDGISTVLEQGDELSSTLGRVFGFFPWPVLSLSDFIHGVQFDRDLEYYYIKARECIRGSSGGKVFVVGGGPGDMWIEEDFVAAFGGNLELSWMKLEDVPAKPKNVFKGKKSWSAIMSYTAVNKHRVRDGLNSANVDYREFDSKDLYIKFLMEELSSVR